jgi:hypothetical protein
LSSLAAGFGSGEDFLKDSQKSTMFFFMQKQQPSRDVNALYAEGNATSAEKTPPCASRESKF